MPTNTLGITLRDTRAAHDLSLQQVADRAGCSPGYVHKLEMDRVRKPPTGYRVNGITSLVCAFVNSKSLSTKFKHLRHKRKTLQATPFVKGPQDLIPASNFHPVSRPQFHNDLAMLDLTRLSTNEYARSSF